MAGETDLSVLLKNLRPETDNHPYWFCSISQERFSQLPGAAVKGFFRESEGITVIATSQDVSTYGLTGDGPFACITCNIHSGLEAVGMTAAISEALTQAQIPANVVAAYYHDHIFVPWEEASRAEQILQALKKQ